MIGCGSQIGGDFINISGAYRHLPKKVVFAFAAIPIHLLGSRIAVWHEVAVQTGHPNGFLETQKRSDHYQELLNAQ